MYIKIAMINPLVLGNRNIYLFEITYFEKELFLFTFWLDLL